MKLYYIPLVGLALGLATLTSAQTQVSSPDMAPLKIIQTQEPVFPYSLQNTLVLSGTAKIVIDIDDKGKLIECLVTGYSRPEFADSAIAALQKWKYEPPRINGTPWGTVQEISFNYERSGVVVSMLSFEAMNRTIDSMMQASYAFRAYTLSELDSIPTPIQVVSPLSPDLDKSGEIHQVTVEFYIDQEGRVRLPAVNKQYVSDEYALSAMSAVRQWRFEPPLVKGRPVLVIARQQFDFLPRSPSLGQK